MVSIYQLKPKFQALLRPLVIRLHKSNVTANQITLAACVGSLLVALTSILLIEHLWILGLIPIWMFIRMALNAIDGMLAKEFNQQTHLGAYLNELCDVISDCGLFAILFFVPFVSPLLVFLFIIFSLLTEYAGVMGPLVGASRHYEGPMGKSDRAFVFGTISAMLATNLCPLTWINTVLIVMNILLIYCLINRVKRGLQESSSKKD